MDIEYEMKKRTLTKVDALRDSILSGNPLTETFGQDTKHAAVALCLGDLGNLTRNALEPSSDEYHMTRAREAVENFLSYVAENFDSTVTMAYIHYISRVLGFSFTNLSGSPGMQTFMQNYREIVKLAVSAHI